MTNTRITDPEVLEHRYPVRLERFAVRRGSGGAGAHRGGDGAVRELVFLEPMQLSLLTQHRVERPYGAAGGEPGAPGRSGWSAPAGGGAARLGRRLRRRGRRSAGPGDARRRRLGSAVRRLGSIVFWSVIAAAFIGPGTVTTAALAGASHGLALLWALGFSTVACLVLQEASARLTATSGRDLAQALRESYRRGPGGALILVLVIGAIGVGCAAYEAGNLLGAAAGARLILGLSPGVLALAAGAVAAVLLWVGAPRAVANSLALLVALMGVAFLVTAGMLFPGIGPLLRGCWSRRAGSPPAPASWFSPWSGPPWCPTTYSWARASLRDRSLGRSDSASAWR